MYTMQFKKHRVKDLPSRITLNRLYTKYDFGALNSYLFNVNKSWYRYVRFACDVVPPESIQRGSKVSYGLFLTFQCNKDSRNVL